MKRRDFISKASVATIGICVAPAILPSGHLGLSAPKPMKMGIIGTGARGSGLIPFINEIDNLEVAACCDVLSFRLENALNRCENSVEAYSDYRKLLEDPTIDAVLIATPFSMHEQMALDAIDAGKHVYCEKTMAKGYAGLQKLVTAASGSNNVFQTGHQYHSSRLYGHVAQQIKSGMVGNISAVECQWNRHGNWRRAVPNENLEKIINWRMYREYSGGLVAELCSHQIDFVNWISDSLPETVMGVGGIDYWKDGRETFDNIHLIYTYPKGIKATFTCLTSNAKDGYQIKVIGDKGTIILDYAKAWFYPEGSYKKTENTEVDGVSGATRTWEKGMGIPIKIEHLDPSKQALIDFRDCIQKEKIPITNALTGANTAACVQMALDAMYENKIVKWRDFMTT